MKKLTKKKKRFFFYIFYLLFLLTFFGVFVYLRYGGDDIIFLKMLCVSVIFESIAALFCLSSNKQAKEKQAEKEDRAKIKNQDISR